MPGAHFWDLGSALGPMRSNLSMGRAKTAPKSRLQIARVLLGLLGGLGRFAVADFVRC